MKQLMIVALLTMVQTANAQTQDWGEMYNLAAKFMLIKTKTPYAVMSYPITYWDYYIVTGKNIRPSNRSVTDVAPISGSQARQNFAKQASQLWSGINVHVATPSELQKALGLRYNISSESGPYSHTTRGFYLAMDYQSYKKMKKLMQEYQNGRKPNKRKPNKIRPARMRVRPGAVG